MEQTMEMMELIGELSKLSKEIRRAEKYADSLRQTRNKLKESGGQAGDIFMYTYQLVDQERKIRALTDDAMNRVHALAELYNVQLPTESQEVQP